MASSFKDVLIDNSLKLLMVLLFVVGMVAIIYGSCKLFGPLWVGATIVFGIVLLLAVSWIQYDFDRCDQ